MRSERWSIVGVLLACLGCQPTGGRLVTVSDLQVGDTLPTLTVEAVRSAASPVGTSPDSSCRVLVYFEVECPHCKVAAHLDAIQTTPRYPVTWVTNKNDPALQTFMAGIEGPLSVLASPDAKRRLAIRAVPAAFLVSESNEIRLVFPYSGGIPAESLRPYCLAD